MTTDNIQSPSIKQKVIVKGYVGTVTQGDQWYVYETTNYVGHLPGEKLTREDLDGLIAKGVTVVARRK